MIKKSNWTNGIILSGHLIQVNDFGQGDGQEWQINVTKICKADWSNCKSVANLGNGWNWDSFRRTANKTIYVPGHWHKTGVEVVTPAFEKHLYFHSWFNFYNQWSFNFYTMQGDGGLAGSYITMNAKWLRVLNGNQFYSWAWLSVGWYIVAWNTSTENYIYIMSSWHYNDEDKHYEIMASEELAVWTLWWSYLYFVNTGANSEMMKHRIWINTREPKATLDVWWTIKLKETLCTPVKCDSDTEWTILYRDGKFYWCVNDAPWSAAGSYKRHKFTMGSEMPNTWSESCAGAAAF